MYTYIYTHKHTHTTYMYEHNTAPTNFIRLLICASHLQRDAHPPQQLKLCFALHVGLWV